MALYKFRIVIIIVGRLASGYPDAIGLLTAHADDQDGASSRLQEIC